MLCCLPEVFFVRVTAWLSSLCCFLDIRPLCIGSLGFSCCSCGIGFSETWSIVVVPAAPFRLLSMAGSFGLEGGVLLSNSYYSTSFHLFFFLCHFSADSSVDVLLWISCSCRSYLSLLVDIISLACFFNELVKVPFFGILFLMRSSSLIICIRCSSILLLIWLSNLQSFAFSLSHAV